jgi:signal transduction histidine kinase/ActR/RegA family two-component response regulator
VSFLLKTVLGVAAIEAVLLFLLVFSSNQALSSSLGSEMDKRAKTTLALLDATARDAILSEDLATLRDVAKLTVDVPDVVYAKITGPDGEVLAEAGMADLPPQASLATLDETVDGADYYSAETRVEEADVHYATLEVGFSMAMALAARQELQRKNVLIAVSELALVALFSILLGSYLTRELKKLTDASSAVAAGELGVEVPVKGSDEIAATIRSFNRMSRNLLESQQRQNESEARLAAVLDGLRDGVFLLDEKSRVMFLNPQARIYIEAISPDWEADAPLTHLGRHALATFFEHGFCRETIDIELEGLTRWFDFSIFQGQRFSASRPEWILTLRDVTAQRLREERDRKGEQLAIVGQLAAGIAHDFNNILSIIFGVADLNLLHKQSLPEDLGRDFETIREQSKRASALVRQILDFGRSEGREVGELDLCVALRSIVGLLSRTLPQSIELVCEFAPSGTLVEFDAGALEQVVANLILNAADAMPDGGKITLRVTTRVGYQLRAAARPDAFERWVCLEIVDEGEGIPAGNLNRIFEPFFTTKAKSKGTGLGLAQVFGIMHQHHGDVEVDSEPGRGSTFTVFLSPAESSEDSVVTARKGKSERSDVDNAACVLVVEDQAALLKTLTVMLESLGYVVLTADGGAQGLEAYKAQKDAIDLILTDAVMPEIDGLELISRLRGLGCELPIVLMSGYFPREAVDLAALGSALDGFLQKPVGLEELRTMMRDTLNRGRGQPSG